MKRLLAIVLGAALAVSLTACSLFGGGDNKEVNNDLFEVKITDDITHEDPTDIEFEKRYTLYSGGNKELKDWYKEGGFNLVEEYFVLYGDKDDVPLRNYYYWVFETEEDAAKYQEQMKEYNLDVDLKGTVVIQVIEQEALLDTIESYIALTVLDDKTASGYAKANKEQFEELIDYTGK